MEPYNQTDHDYAAGKGCVGLLLIVLLVLCVIAALA